MMHPAAHHPGPPDVTPHQRLLMLDEDAWEKFIEECVRQLMAEGAYVHVQHLGGAGDKGRDVCGYTQELPVEDTWDLFQAKHYASPLAPAIFEEDLAKFLYNVFSLSYTRPRKYYICASRDVGTKLFDLLRKPEALRDYLLDRWTLNSGDFGGFKQQLTQELELFIRTFSFEIFTNKTPADLLEIHARNASLHWQKFGILPLREGNPAVPSSPTDDEQRYVSELLAAYAEYSGVSCNDISEIPKGFRRHFATQRRLFYTAEGLSRFSRDKLPGAFDNLLDQVELGVGTVVHSPHPSALTRLSAVLSAADSLSIGSNALKNRIQAGDLQGSCHHLANQGRVSWVYKDEDDGK